MDSGENGKNPVKMTIIDSLKNIGLATSCPESYQLSFGAWPVGYKTDKIINYMRQALEKGDLMLYHTNLTINDFEVEAF